MKNKIIITQSNYIPWKGYFSSMKKATHLVLYDEMQYTKRDWRNRNKIITKNGLKWLTIPVNVKGKYHQKINEACISDPKWYKKHWNSIKHAYIRAPYFKKYEDVFESLYLSDCQNQSMLSNINKLFLKKIIEILKINIQVLDCTEFDISGDKTGKLINICNQLQAGTYYTGPAAKSYIDESKFSKNNIKLEYYDLSHFPEYKQMWDGFDHHVSIIDMIFNLGENANKHF